MQRPSYCFRFNQVANWVFSKSVISRLSKFFLDAAVAQRQSHHWKVYCTSKKRLFWNSGMSTILISLTQRVGIPFCVLQETTHTSLPLVAVVAGAMYSCYVVWVAWKMRSEFSLTTDRCVALQRYEMFMHCPSHRHNYDKKCKMYHNW